MKNDVPIELKEDLFYLCGVGRRLSNRVHRELARDSTNVHLAVRPRKGSIAAIGSVYGAKFVIEDAQTIPIRFPDREFPALMALDEPFRTEHARCKMFHFAYQMFDVQDQDIGREGAEPVHKLRKEWQGLSGIRQDESGRMIDPKPFW